MSGASVFAAARFPFWARWGILLLGLALLRAAAQGPPSALPSAGPAWSFLGPNPISDNQVGPVGGNVTALAFSSTGTIYAATGWGGIWESSNNGGTWTNISDAAAPLGLGAFTVNALAITPDGGTIYAGTGSLSDPGVGAVGLLCTTNGGATWQTLGPVVNDTITAVDASQAPALAVAVLGPAYAGVWWTGDATGSSPTWSDVAPGAVTGFARLGALAWAAVGGSVDYWGNLTAGVAGAAPQQTLTPTWPAPPAAVYLAASSHVIAALAVDGNGACLAVETSAAGTQSFSPIAPGAGDGCPPNDSGGAAAFPAAIAFDANGNLWLGGAGLWDWPSGASNWTQVSGIPGAVHVVASGPAGNLDAATSYGLWSLPAGSLSWQDITGSLPALQLTSVTATALNQTWVGAQQGGVATAQPPGGQAGWTTAIPNSNGGMVAAASGDANNPNTVYAALPNISGIESSTDGGAFFSLLPFDGPVAGPSPLLVVDPKNALQIYFANSQAWSSSDGGVSWSLLCGGPPAGAVTALTVADGANGPILAAGSSGGQICFDAGDGGWQAGPVSGAPVTAIAAAGDTVIVGLAAPASGALSGYLYLSTNSGTAWTAIGAASLPPRPVIALSLDPVDPSVIYAGLASGAVYASPDLGQTWYQLGSGLPMVPVTTLTLDSASRELLAATNGRGAWAIQLGKAAENITQLAASTPTGPGATVALSAAVLNAFGAPSPDVTVNWTATAGSPPVATGTLTAAATTTGGTATTMGQTANSLTLPLTLAGPITITAAVAGSPQGEATLTVSVPAGAPAQLVAAAGAGQSGAVNLPLSQAVAAEVQDPYGNPVAGVPVAFTDGGVGGSFTPLTCTSPPGTGPAGETVSATTCSNGQASVTYILPAKPGAVTLTATCCQASGATGVSLAPVHFAETANPAPQTTLSLTLDPKSPAPQVGATIILDLASTSVPGMTNQLITQLQCVTPVVGCNNLVGNLNPGQSTSFTVSFGDASVGVNNVTVQGQFNGAPVTATYAVTVPQPGFSLALTPPPAAAQDAPISLAVIATPVNGGYASIALTCIQPATGCTLSPASISPNPPNNAATVTIAAGTL
ncbi:MAG: hypothetical protein ACRD2E_07750, partial [Terriglobales bacterium]